MSELVRRDPSSVPAVFEPRPQDIWIDNYLREKDNEISRAVSIILKRKWLILSVALVVFAAAAVRTYNTKPSYTSSVNIQIDPEQTVLPFIYDSTGAPNYLATQIQVLKSETLARRIVIRLNLAPDSDRATGLASWFKANLEVTPVEYAQVLKVTFRSEDPAFAAKAVNTLADEYAIYSFEVKRDATTRARDFLDKELFKQQQKLEQSEQALVKYGREHKILLPTEANNVIMQKLTDLNQEMTKVETEVLSSQYEALKDTTLESFPEKLKTSVMRDLDSRRSGLEGKLATTTAQFGPKWPEVLLLNRELSDVREQLANEKRKALEQANVEYNLAVAHRQRLAAAVTAQNHLADQLTQDSIQYNILKRGVETDRQLHEGLLQRLKETDVSAGLKSVNVHVIDGGHVPTTPSSPNVQLNLMVGLTLGLVSGVMCAAAAAFLDRTVKTPEDVERDLRLPFLGAIPAFDKSWKEASGGLLMPLNWQPPENARHYVYSGADMYWESYRALRTSLLFSSPEKRSHSILVTSALPGEGKSTTVVNLAITLAQTGARTLILELDMRRPKMADMFQVKKGQGMSRYLSGQSELNTEIHQTGIPNLFVVPAGPIPPNPPELIGSPRMSGALELLRRYFEYVIIDGPPVISVTDAVVIASRVNGVILVVQGGKTPIAAVQKARNLLRSVDANVLGTLVNNVKMDVSQIYYPAISSSAQETYLARTDTAGLH
jgi:succinoglycan biosynthesis transport protein ExoP